MSTILPVAAKMAAAAELAETITAELETHEHLKAQALRLVADNSWCVNALAARGITVDSSQPLMYER